MVGEGGREGGRGGEGEGETCLPRGAALVPLLLQHLLPETSSERHCQTTGEVLDYPDKTLNELVGYLLAH